MQMTRRHFATSLGVVAAGGVTLVTKALAAEKEHRIKHGTAEEIWQDLMTGNKRFVAGQPQARTLVQTRQELANGQHPKVIVLGCADSRLSPELIFDQTLGDLFVVRTAGNIADPVALGSMEYAAEHLHASVLVVLGHEQCGAVAAAASGEKMPSINLQAIVEKIRPAVAQVKSQGVQHEQLVSLAVEHNVHQSAKDVLQHSPILQKAVTAGKLTVIKAVYRLRSGEVLRL